MPQAIINAPAPVASDPSAVIRPPIAPRIVAVVLPSSDGGPVAGGGVVVPAGADGTGSVGEPAVCPGDGPTVGDAVAVRVGVSVEPGVADPVGRGGGAGDPSGNHCRVPSRQTPTRLPTMPPASRTAPARRLPRQRRSGVAVAGTFTR